MRMMLAYSGCWLPLSIFLNLFFGRLFFRTTHWLFIEGILILLFLLSVYINTRRIFSSKPGPANVIDVEARVLEDKDTSSPSSQ